MNTNKLKQFATQARTRLMQGVTHRLTALGFRPDGSVTEQPQEQGGGATFMGRVVSQDFYDKWQSLYRAVERHGIRYIAEEAAYTWFNRLVAVRIMVRNGLIAPVLEFEADGSRVPVIVAEARQGRLPYMDDDSRRQLAAIMDDDSRTDEQFALLITAYCHSHPMLYSCFGRIADYTEMLLPLDILANGGFVAMLNDTGFIDDADYLSPELIGWLYQFYISERKDEVMAKKGKYTPDEIPAATQIFTPNWIVKYMVQNTVGRIWLDNNPDMADDFKPQWKYLVEPSDGDTADHVLRCSLEEMRVADLACGSGHILNECFDILYDLYLAEGYSRRQAIENIFANNLTGVDIDTRAKQLATFALLLKACQKDKSFAEAHAMPRVMDMPHVDRYTWRDLNGHMACALQLRGGGEVVYKELNECFALMEHADSLGSIMKFDISPETRDYMMLCLNEQKRQQKFVKEFAELFKGFELILALTEQYHAIVMNPPYMKAANMDETLKNYVDTSYIIAPIDMYSVFMLFAMNNCILKGRISMIVQPTWLTNYTFGNLRNMIIDHFFIESLLHMGRGNFGNDWGSVAFSITKTTSKSPSIFFKLYERTFYRIEPQHISELFIKAKNNSNFRFKFSQYSAKGFSARSDESGKRLVYLYEQRKFKRISNSPLCYTFSDDIVKTINATQIADCFNPATGLQTGDNKRFIRTWFEISHNTQNIKWFPLVNGGNFRKWYGNFSELIYWYNNGFDIRNCTSSVLRNQQFYFKKGLSWNRIASKGITIRFFPDGCLFDQAGDSMFANQFEDLLICMGYLNTHVAKYFFDMFAPGINLTAGVIGKLPFKKVAKSENVLTNVSQNITISRADWDAHETSWDFRRNELLTIDETAFWEILNEYCDFAQVDVDPAPPEPQSLEWRTDIYKMKWRTKLLQLHANEKELNRQFIDIYGLQDELTPDVPLDEVTILQQGEISVIDSAEGTHVNRDKTIPYEIVWHDDVLMKQFISYAVGCMMGRYSIDKPGLVLANQGDGIERYNELVPGSRFDVDDDGIIPLMPSDTWFSDNATLRFKLFVETVFGSATLNENLNFIERALGKSIDTYFVKDFWKDHKKMYQNRPIYWLFSSKKGAFQCAAYMHRMDAYTAERIRSKYLLPHIEWLVGKAQEFDDAPTLTTPERKQLDSLRKQIAECREYHDRLHVVADRQIAFDLDDGVLVNYAKFGDVLSKLK